MKRVPKNWDEFHGYRSDRTLYIILILKYKTLTVIYANKFCG